MSGTLGRALPNASAFLRAGCAALALATALGLAGVASAAGERETLLADALAAYREAQEAPAGSARLAAFARAERLLAAVAERGPASADLFANVGTAALQAEHLGAAVLAYRRALALDPDHRRAQQNLLHTRTLLPGWVPRPEGGGMFDTFLGWSRALSQTERRGAAALAFFAGAALAGAAIGGAGAALRFFAAVPLALWLLLVMASTISGGDRREAVLLVDDTVARAADSTNAPARFAEPLPAGTEVHIAEERGAFRRVLLADGRDAWVAAASVAPIAGGG